MRALSIALVAALCAALASPVSADDNKGKGPGQGHGSPNVERNDNDRGHGGPAVVPHEQIVIIDRDRDRVRTYYRNEYLAGRCPPGLAKKGNGCMPPGLAKRVWVVGQPLPPEIVYYPVPGELFLQLTPPPPGYEYVRVDNDVLLISSATRLIAGVLANLGSF